MTRISAFLTVLFTGFLLVACQLVEAPTVEGAAVTPSVDSGAESPLIAEQQCQAAGGQMVIGLAGPQCARPEPDAGKACKSSAECSGVCLAATKSCSPVAPYFGCHEVLEGGQTAVLCID